MSENQYKDSLGVERLELLFNEDVNFFYNKKNFRRKKLFKPNKNKTYLPDTFFDF